MDQRRQEKAPQRPYWKNQNFVLVQRISIQNLLSTARAGKGSDTAS